MIHPHNGIPLGNKKEQTANRCYAMHEPQKHYNQWEKTDIKKATYSKNLFIWSFYRRQNFGNRKQIKVCLPGPGVGME